MKRIVVLMSAVLPAFFLAPLADAQTMGQGMMGWGYGGYGNYGGWDPFGFIWGIFWIALIVFVIVAVVRWVAPGRRSWRLHEGGRSPMDILKERYAKGEIDRGEFEEKKKDLES